MDDRKKKKDDEKRPEQRKGSVEPCDKELAEWLLRPWLQGEHPSKVELWPVGGRNYSERGTVAYEERFKPDQKMGPEQIAVLVNQLHGLAQKQADNLNRVMIFEVALYDEAVRKGSIAVKLPPFHPQQLYFKKDEESEDEMETAMRPLIIRYLGKMLPHGQWKDEMAFRVVGDSVLTLKAIIADQRMYIKQLEDRNLEMQRTNMDMHRMLQETQDHSLDRELARKKQEFWFSLTKDGVHSARNLLLGAAAETKTGQKNGAAVRELIALLFRDLKDAGLHDRVMGAWEKDESEPDGVRCTAPGILTNEQIAILLRVRDGVDEVDALDGLMEGQHALSMSQLGSLMAILPPSIQTGVMSIMDSRKKKTPLAQGGAQA